MSGYIRDGSISSAISRLDQIVLLLQFCSYPKCTLHDDYGRLLECKQFTDVDFIVGKGSAKINAHIAMVAARSTWLRNRIRQARDHVSTCNQFYIHNLQLNY